MHITKSSSQIITAFVQAQQELEIDQFKKKFDRLTNDLKNRRKDLFKKQGVQTKRYKTVDSSKAESFKSMDEHKVTLQELEFKLETNLIDGMSEEKAKEKLQELGRNLLKEKKRTPWYIKLLQEYNSFFAWLLWIGAILSFIAYGIDKANSSNLYLGLVLTIVNLISGFVAFLQNSKSESIMEAFKNFIPAETQVIRNGKSQKLQAVDVYYQIICKLVPGDIVIIENGKRIPADIRIIECHEMKVDNSSLTGESQLLLRSVECTNENPLETKNLAFFGTLCKEGNGKGVVIFTGDRTVLGQIANLAVQSGNEKSPLKRELNRFMFIITIIAACTGISFFVLGFALGNPASTNIVSGIGIIVANVPEGLLTTVTIALTLTARKLAKLNVLVKNLDGVETLGSTSCICSDKTGTLTRNKMTVEHLWYNNTKFRGHNRQKMGDHFQYEYDYNEIGFRTLHECAVICSDAFFDTQLPLDQFMKIQNNNSLTQPQKDQILIEAKRKWETNLNQVSWLDRPTVGDASETALIKFFQPINDIVYTRSQFQVCKDFENKPVKQPFNSADKYAFIIVEQETPDSYYCLYTKGAPEKVWSFCDKAYYKGKLEAKDENWEQQFTQINTIFGKQGERVLGFSKLHLPKDEFPKGINFNTTFKNFPFNSQGFCGLISLIDPPKDNVPYAVTKCKTAGIQVIMVTGDQPTTATAIARQCNIITEKTANEIAEEEGISFEDACKKAQAIVIHGDRLTKMAIDEEGLPLNEKGKLLQQWLRKPQIVFARTSPAQKLIIVDGCQKMGHIVAVTGDGVNDSPAIKKADIGISMGITGSDVAKDAADMILLNDDFSSIVVGIEEGRKLFDNLKKTISYIITTNVPSLVPFISFIIFQIPVPLSTFLILTIDLGTNIIPSTGYVFEDPELDIMARRPRTQSEHLVSMNLIFFSYSQTGVVSSFGAFLQWFITMNDFGLSPNEVFFLNKKQGVVPNRQDVFDPESPWLGNSNLRDAYLQNQETCVGADLQWVTVDWLYLQHSSIDLRQMIVYCDQNDGQFKQNVQWGQCNVNQISSITERPVCWSTEANKYAQSSFFFAIVICQIGVYFACLTIKISILFQGIKNTFILFGLSTELVLVAFLAYCHPFNVAFGTRDVIFQHFGICAIPFSILMIFQNEFRKFMIFTQKPSKPNRPNWWTRCVAF